MHPSSVAASPIAVQESPPGASFPGQDRIPRPGERANPASSAPASKWGRSPRNSLMSSEFADLMEEPAGGENHGRTSAGTTAGRDSYEMQGDGLVALGVADHQAAEFMRATGWTVSDTSRGTHRGGAREAGMSAHRGVLHPEEYVDLTASRGAVEDELGFTVEELHSVYSTGGRIPSDRLDLRDRVDARLLQLSDSGANMDLFGRVTGLNGSTVDRALARARRGPDA